MTAAGRHGGDPVGQVHLGISRAAHIAEVPAILVLGQTLQVVGGEELAADIAAVMVGFGRGHLMALGTDVSSQAGQIVLLVVLITGIALDPPGAMVHGGLIEPGGHGPVGGLGIAGGVVAQTAIQAVAPGEHALIVHQGGREVGTGGQADHIGALGADLMLHGTGHFSRAVGLALGVKHHAAGGILPAAGIAGPGIGECELQRAVVDFHGSLVLDILRGAAQSPVTQLAVDIPAPADDAAVVEEGQGEPFAVVDLQHLPHA